MTDFRVDVQIFDEFANVVSERDVLEAVSAALESESCDPDTHVSVVIADDEVVRELNRQHRGLDENTDVLSFSFTHEGEYYGEEERDARDHDVDFVLPPSENDDDRLERSSSRTPKRAGRPSRPGTRSDRSLPSCWCTAFCTSSATITRNRTTRQ